MLQSEREHYLRDDIWCGSEVCKKCLQKPENVVLEEENPGAKSTLFSSSYYALLDTNIVLDQASIIRLRDSYTFINSLILHNC